MNAWKLVAGLLVLLGVFQVLAAFGAPTLTAGVTTAVTGLLFLAAGFMALYRAEIN